MTWRNISVSAIGPGATPALPALAKALEDRLDSVRLAVAYALGEIGEKGGGAVVALIRVLAEDRDDEVRQEAAFALGEIAIPMASAPLEKALQDRAEIVRQAAQDAIEKLDEEGEDPAAPKRPGEAAAKKQAEAAKKQAGPRPGAPLAPPPGARP